MLWKTWIETGDLPLVVSSGSTAVPERWGNLSVESTSFCGTGDVSATHSWAHTGVKERFSLLAQWCVLEKLQRGRFFNTCGLPFWSKACSSVWCTCVIAPAWACASHSRALGLRLAGVCACVRLQRESSLLSAARPCTARRVAKCQLVHMAPWPADATS